AVGPSVTFEVVNHRTGKVENSFVPGDRYYLRIKNDWKENKPVWIELVFTSQYGLKEPTGGWGVKRLAPGEEINFPARNAKEPYLELDETLGVDFYTLYFSDQPFAPGVLVQLRPTNPRDDPKVDHPEVRDRFVHPFYQIDKDKNVITNTDASRLAKRTVEVET